MKRSTQLIIGIVAVAVVLAGFGGFVLVHHKQVVDSHRSLVPGLQLAWGTPAGETALKVCVDKMSAYVSANVWNEQGAMSTEGVRIGKNPHSDLYEVEFSTVVEMGCGVMVDPKTAKYEGRYGLTVDGKLVQNKF